MPFKTTCRASAIATALLALPACSRKSNSGAEDAGPKSVTAEELNIDFSGAAHVEEVDEVAGGSFGLTLDQFKSRWNELAPKHKGVGNIGDWKIDPWVAQQLTAATSEIGADLSLDVDLRGKELLHSVTITIEAPALASRPLVLAAWDTLMEVLSPALVDVGKKRNVYEGLGLLAKPTVSRKNTSAEGVKFEVVDHSNRPNGKSIEFVATPITSKVSRDKPFALEFPPGKAPGFGQVGPFVLASDPAGKGKTFQEAADHCRSRGLYLCTEPLWQAACSIMPDISAIETWTASFTSDHQKLQVRGGGDGCESGGGSLSTDAKPERAALCCSRIIAFTDNPLKQLPMLSILDYEQGLNRRDRSLVIDSLADTVVKFYGQILVPRDTVVQNAMSYVTSKPQSWSVHDACVIGELIAKKRLFVTCTHNVFEGDKAMVTQSQYAMDLPSSKLTWIQDPRVFRRNGAF
jgi:hypothetical protein